MYTLVIVDDEPAIAEGICRLLDWKSLGFERIRTARSCFEVVSHVVDWKPDVCLVDVRIGNEFGYELINCLNGMGVKSNYIMMSGYDDFQYACEALRCGAVDYLLKPLDKDQLQKRIEQVVVENLHGTVQLEVRKNEDPILRRPYEEFSPLADAVILVATSPKSNSAHDAINAAIADVQAGRTGPIPRQLQNKHFDGEDAAVKGQNYKYAHDYENHWVDQQYLPDLLKDVKYYTFGDNRTEQAARAYWAKIKGEDKL